jgi:membrane protease YdiL (CAAX protease family)
MAVESKSLIPQVASERRLLSEPLDGSARNLWGLFQVGLVFGFIMVAVWTPQGRFNTIVSLLTMLCIVWFTVRSRYSARELGLVRPGSGVIATLVSGACMIVAVVVAGSVMHRFGSAQQLPWRRAWQYAIWALEQEFILQSFFYVRLESLSGSRRAVWGAAVLFSSAHLPSPVLTFLSFVGGLLFCELFRRYRNIFPLGLIHAALGLTIAETLPDSLLHHMRVGLGYLLYRP